LFFARDWLSTTIEEFVATVDAYIRWYNEVRIKSSLGFRRPPSTAGAWASLHNQPRILAVPPPIQFSVGVNITPVECRLGNAAPYALVAPSRPYTLALVVPVVLCAPKHNDNTLRHETATLYSIQWSSFKGSLQ